MIRKHVSLSQESMGLQKAVPLVVVGVLALLSCVLFVTLVDKSDCKAKQKETRIDRRVGQEQERGSESSETGTTTTAATDRGLELTRYWLHLHHCIFCSRSIICPVVSSYPKLFAPVNSWSIVSVTEQQEVDAVRR
jgi:hypothetical protein